MTREEAIEIIELEKLRYKIHLNGGEKVDNDEYYEVMNEFVEAYDMAIKALEKQPCKNCISRQAVMKLLEKEDWADTVYGVLNLPSVTPQPKIGRWINAKVGKLFPSNDFKCSECGNILDFNGVNGGRGDANYCPNCGAKMEVNA